MEFSSRRAITTAGLNQPVEIRLPGSDIESFTLQPGEVVTITNNGDNLLIVTSSLKEDHTHKGSHSAFNFNPSTLTVSSQETGVNSIPPRLARLLYILSNNIHSVVPPEELMAAIRNSRSSPKDLSRTQLLKTVREEVSALRKLLPESRMVRSAKLDDDHFIRTVHGKGYILYDPNSPDFDPELLEFDIRNVNR